MAKQFNWTGVALHAFSALVYIFLALPVVVVVVASFSSSNYLTFPPPGFSLKWYAAILQSPEWLKAFRLSLLIAALVTPLAAALGTPAAYALVRLRFPGRDVLNAVVLSPLMIPQIMLGIALLYYFQSLRLLNSVTGLVIAHTILALPYVVRAVSVNIYNLDHNLERAAAILGAGFWRTFRDITLPLVKPGILAGAVFAAITSFGELALTIFLSGSGTTTLPLRIFSYIEYTFDPVITAISSIFIFVAIILLVIIDRWVGLTKLF